MADGRLCSIDGCGNPFLARGWCTAHYLKWRKYGSPLAESENKNLPLKWLIANANAQTDDCLTYPFGKTGMGYGVVYPKGEKQMMAHRWMCEHVHGPAPEGKIWVAHSCANGHLACVNPRHLRWATPKQNGEDRVAHGNAPKKLTKEEAAQIWRLKGTMPSRVVGERFGVAKSTVAGIWQSRTWVWLTSAIGP
jgi:hypothetical protein